MSRIARAGVAVAVVVALVVGIVVSRELNDRAEPALVPALQTLPAQTEIASFTDWSGIRSALSTAGRVPTVPRGTQLLDRAYERDLSAVSLLAVSAIDMRDIYGWSVLDADWEIYGQAPQGAVEVLRMPGGFDFEAADQQLARLGYSDAGGGMRIGGADLVASLGGNLTPQLATVVLLPDERLIVTSDRPSYAALTLDAIDGSADSVYDAEGVEDMAEVATDDALAATLLVGDRACRVAGFQDFDAGTRAVVRQRIAEVGGVAPINGLTLALDASGVLTVVMHFADPEAAAADQSARAALATGEAPGQGGTFEDRFEVVSAEVIGRELVLRLRPGERDAKLLSDLGRGGLLFAAC